MHAPPIISKWPELFVQMTYLSIKSISEPLGASQESIFGNVNYL